MLIRYSTSTYPLEILVFRPPSRPDGAAVQDHLNLFGTKRVAYEMTPDLTDQLILLTTEFVNAQYRFVMNPSGDYVVHFADPDMYACRHDSLW
jgi:hypothetical protein